MVRLNRSILFLIDGLHPEVGVQELRAGHLPNIGRLVQRGGAGRVITAFPSTTSVAYLPFLTGCLPGRSNVPSIRWLDRAAYTGRWWRDRDAVRSYCGYQAGRFDQDIAPEAQTIFELVPESAAFFTMIAKGLGPQRDPTRAARKLWGALSHYAQWHQPGDDVVARHLLRWIERDPDWRFLFAQFPAVDGYTHQSHPAAPAVLAALRKVDLTIGRLTAQLERAGIDDTLILLVSDHGASRVNHHLDLADWFRERGVRTLAHPELWRRAPTAAVMVAGNGSAMIYARPGEPRSTRWPLARLRQPATFGSNTDLVAELVAEPAVAFVAAEEGPGTISVADRRGEAVVRSVAGLIEYRIGTADPLDIGQSALLDHRKWLDLTFNRQFPDGPVQLLDQFRSHRTGDLVVVAHEGFDFRDRWEIPEHKSGHGSLIRDHMQAALWANHPLGSAPLRTADLFATILDWLGVPVPSGIDGELVWRPSRTEAVAEPRPEVHLSSPLFGARSSAG